MRYILSVLIVFCLICPDTLGQRKKVGVVLSGGGAKGVAHIGVLKVLEEAGIPIDYISGTSMGAIVGGLYAVGYNAKALDSLVRMQNWPFLLSDKVYRFNQPFTEKESNEKYLISLSFSQEKGLSVPAGFVSGQNIYNLFSELTIGFHDSIPFRDLPIPFACVSANMIDGKEVVMDKGILPLAMRASMAIPGVFAPVTIDSMVLVDGGISNNFPVDVAKNMGAEITIGVDLSTGLKDEKGLDNIMGIVDQLTAFMGMKSYENNKAMVDLYMNPDLKGFTDQTAGSHHGADGDQVIVVDRDIKMFCRDTAAGRSTGLRRLELFAVWNAAADLFDNFTQRGSHRNLYQTGIVDLAA